MTRLASIRLEQFVSRADQTALTPEQVAEVQGELLDLMIEWCEARGYLLNGSMSPESGEGEESS
ncbi:hypothetical protein [Deinococcus sp.]|uniref:hypothetical protein n=1 Tax=Deinococcus sp. TaxID=47478 RepID=UPI003C7CB99D